MNTLDDVFSEQQTLLELSRNSLDGGRFERVPKYKLLTAYKNYCESLLAFAQSLGVEGEQSLKEASKAFFLEDYFREKGIDIDVLMEREGVVIGLGLAIAAAETLSGELTRGVTEELDGHLEKYYK